MDLTIIKLFVASSVVEFSNDRAELAAFVASLNNHYVKRGLYFELTICENVSTAVALGRKQEEYNEAIRNSQYCYIIIGQNVGEFTLEEFDVALDSFQSTGYPKLYTYFRLMSEGQHADESVMLFMKRLDEELGHYYQTYDHLDSLKLSMLLELARSGDNARGVAFRDGYAEIEGDPLLSLKNIPMYRNCDVIQNMGEELEELNRAFADATVAHGRDPEDKDAEARWLTISSERAGLYRKYRDAETGMLNACMALSKIQGDGIETFRTKKASELLNAGDYDGVLAVLSDSQRKDELKQAELLVENALSRIRGYIAESRLLISALCIDLRDDNNLKKVVDCYDEIAELILRYNLESDDLFEYVQFLLNQGEYEKGILVCKKIIDRLNETQPGNENAITLAHTLMGDLRLRRNDISGAIIEYETGLETATGAEGMARALQGLGQALCINERYSEARPILEKAVRLYETHEQVPARSHRDGSVVLKCYAECIASLGDLDEAKAVYDKGIALLRETYFNEPDENCLGLAELCRSAGKFLAPGDPWGAREYFLESMGVFKRLSKTNPSAYLRNIAAARTDLAWCDLLMSGNELTNAEQYMESALSLIKRLVDFDSLAYMPDLIKATVNMSFLAEFAGKDGAGDCDTESRAFMDEALALLETYRQRQPEHAELLVSQILSCVEQSRELTYGEEVKWIFL